MPKNPHTAPLNENDNKTPRQDELPTKHNYISIDEDQLQPEKLIERTGIIKKLRCLFCKHERIDPWRSS